jgi:hypothetical protein
MKSSQVQPAEDRVKFLQEFMNKFEDYFVNSFER